MGSSENRKNVYVFKQSNESLVNMRKIYAKLTPVIKNKEFKNLNITGKQTEFHG